MKSSTEIKEGIQAVIGQLMDSVLKKVLIDDPFIKDDHRSKKPLYAALVPDEIFKGSHFERRFVTPFGNIWEKLAVVAAQKGLGYGTQNYTITGSIKQEKLRRITEILNQLEHGRQGTSKIRPDWDKELEYIESGNSDKKIGVTVVCDVYAEDKQNGAKYAFEIKAPLPNSDQTKVSKEKILKLYCMEPKIIDNAYFALPYNPYGKREDYDWSFPSRWFDMKHDEVVLIGNEFWNKIGGVSTYETFIEAVNEIGPKYKERIYKEFLGIKPPTSDKWKM
jgi:hypothetical protein